MSDCFKIFDNNWAFDPSVDIVPSSQSEQFPAENLSQYSRSRVWRSSGYFKIEAGINDAIDFDEGSGELNATITAGEYDTDGLASAIVSAMESVGTNDYEVQKLSGSGRWEISSDGVTFSILWASGTNTATTLGAVIGFDVSVDDTGALEYTSASTANHTEEFVIFDLGTWGGNSVDAFAILFDPVLGPKLSSECTLTLEANQTLNFDSPALTVPLSIDNDWKLVAHFFTTAETYRYWKLKVVDIRNPELAIEISKVFIGTLLDLDQPPEVGWVDRANDLSSIQSTEFGNEYFDILPSVRFAQFSWKALTETDKVTLKQFYLTHGKVRAFLIYIDPEENTFSNFKEHALYCRLNNDFESTQSFATYFDMNMEVKEVL